MEALKEITTNLTILNAKQIQELYGFTRDITYEILRSKGCPLIRGSAGSGKKYLVEKSAFENFIVERSERMRRK